MSEEKDNSAEDPIKQIKGEFSRKTDKLADQLQAMATSQAELLNQLNRMSKPAPVAKVVDDMSALMYKDPAAYAQRITEQAEERIMGRINQQSAVQQQAASVIGELANEYPELANAQDPLTKKAIERLSQMPEQERNSGSAMRLAVREAAEELEVKPRSRRPVEDDFSGSSSSGYGVRPGRSSSKNKIEPEVQGWADVLGLDTTDPTVKERLIARQNKSWSSPRDLISTKPKRSRK